MNISKWVIGAIVVGVGVGGAACTNAGSDEVVDQTQSVDTVIDATKDGAVIVVDETKKAGEATADATKGIVETTGDTAKEVVAGVGSATKNAVSTTGEAITDGWITTKVKAKFVDETVLEGSDIDVDTNSYVVTLKGRVSSNAAKSRAAAIALGTEGVTRVVNDLVVRAS